MKARAVQTGDEPKNVLIQPGDVENFQISKNPVDIVERGRLLLMPVDIEEDLEMGQGRQPRNDADVFIGELGVIHVQTEKR